MERKITPAVSQHRLTPNTTTEPSSKPALEWMEGNHIQFYQDTQEAYLQYLQIIAKAETFISLENFNLESDRYGREIMDALIQRAHEGVRIRMVIDRLSKGTYGSEEGYVWLKQADIDRLRGEPNIELVFDDPIEFPRRDHSGYGPMVFMHRKWLVADIQDEQGNTQLTAFGGERVMSSVSFDAETRTRPKWNETALAWMIPTPMGWGPFEDVSWVIQGPVVERIHQKILDDFVTCGGIAPQANDPTQAVAQPTAAEDGIKLAYVTQEAKKDHKCTDEWLSVVAGTPGIENENIVIVNSFTPDQKNQEAMIAAVKAGKHVVWITGGLFYQFQQRSQVAARLQKAGVDVRIIPEQLHMKMVANQSEIAAGSVRMDASSDKSYESLIVMPTSADEAQPLVRKFEDLQQRSISLRDVMISRGMCSDTPLWEVASLVRELSHPPLPENPSQWRANTQTDALLNMDLFISTLSWQSPRDLPKDQLSPRIRVTRDVLSTGISIDHRELPVAKTNFFVPQIPLAADDFQKMFFPTQPDEVADANVVMQEFGEIQPYHKSQLPEAAQNVAGDFFAVTRHLGWPFQDKDFNVLVTRQKMPNGVWQIHLQILSAEQEIEFGLTPAHNPYQCLELTISIEPDSDGRSNLTMAYVVNPGMPDFVPMQAVSQKTEADTRKLLKRMPVY